MFTITKNELKNELFSLKSIVIIGIYIGVAYLIGQYGPAVAAVLPNGDSKLYTTLFSAYEILGFVFAAIIFSGVFTREIETQTIRFLIPYMNRTKIYLGKYLAILSYFIVLIVVSICIVGVLKRQFVLPWGPFFKAVGFFMYVSSITLLISLVSKNVKNAGFVSLIISFGSFVIYISANISNNVLLQLINFVLPYQYIDNDYGTIILTVLALIFGLLGWKIFMKKEV
ncbi:ABC transporter permease subunit [Leuconostoc pseudomesenteroides]|uniref:ABC transporter permease subunit n=1 Tax=Leuconostoc pseudomesenteroides TaxID=33968 RepID=UPI002286B99D|nr:ABC transporter permease subunit [Leuconostoc pseudomesenteroides]WAM38548.1 hypothetical protein OYT93_10220 [Leuconostoc pseudomesenteroides]